MKTVLIGAMLLLGLGGIAEARDISGRVSVRDADTLVVGGTPVRLNGVDAPENFTRAGRDATNFMKRVVRGQTVACRLNGDRTYDRWVGVCYVQQEGEWVDLGAIMVANGYALDCRRYSGGRYRSLEPRGARQRLPQERCCRFQQCLG